ncbi:MAG: LysM domain-containing protein [Planktotalea sp.]|uniref:LysM peptidoglycan-binding domain-containing protein n=1 Tax=Planktotalea sp. TaxID=2029877 RepID=UPI003C7561E8
MMRSITIFSFFALATVLVIVLQPGPRPSYVYEQSENALRETSRNEVDVLNEPKATPALQAPDEVISRLKAAARPAPAIKQAEPTSNLAPGGSLTRLQAALDASLGTNSVTSDADPEPVTTVQTAPEPIRPVAQTMYQAVEPELRDMSWQTLNTLNSLGHKTKGPGQEGSLLNSIVRRSMGQVGNQPTAPVTSAVRAVPAPAQPALRTSAVQSGAKKSYVVASGDTLALIAIKLYGSALATDKLLSENPVLRQNPDALRIGQVLRYSNQ